MPAGAPKFSPFPFAALRPVSAADAALESALARHLAARPLGARVAKLAGAGARARLVGVRSEPFDPHAAHAEVRLAAGVSIVVACAARPIKRLAQRLFGGPPELDAPRPLTAVEEAAWVLVVASALEDAAIAGEVWPAAGLPAGSTITRSGPRVHARIHDPDSGAASGSARDTAIDVARVDTMVAGLAAGRGASTHVALELVIERHGSPWTVVAYVPRALEVRVPAPRALPAWELELPIVVGRCALPRADIPRLAVRDVVTIERSLAIDLGPGTIGLTAAPNAVEARVATGYVRAPMPEVMADAAEIELTVQLGTTRLTVRQLGELVPGSIISLGKPLAGPYEIRAAGRLIGRGELVDVDGELGVRIVSLEE